MIFVREVAGDDWELLRKVRLSALAEAPYAFGSTHAREALFTEAQWRGRISERSVTFFASRGESSAPDGLAGVYIEDGLAQLVSMWVRPASRGLGVGSALVSAVREWAKAHDFAELCLWVTESNEPARVLYARSGFVATGERQPLPSDPSLQEIQMRLAL